MAYTARIRTVPDSNPNSEGAWIPVLCDDSMLEKIKTATSWMRMVQLLNEHVEANHHIVQIDLRCVLELRPMTKIMRFEDE